MYNVDDSVYRSEAPNRNEDFIYLSSIGVKSVFDLGYEESDTTFDNHKLFKFKQIPIGFLNPPSDDEMLAILQYIKTAPKPLLIHCMAGGDRTGLVIAMYVFYLMVGL